MITRHHILAVTVSTGVAPVSPACSENYDRAIETNPLISVLPPMAAAKMVMTIARTARIRAISP